MVNVVMWTLVILFFLAILSSVINTASKGAERMKRRDRCAACGSRLRWNRAAGHFYRTCFRCGAEQIIPPKQSAASSWIKRRTSGPVPHDEGELVDNLGEYESPDRVPTTPRFGSWLCPDCGAEFTTLHTPNDACLDCGATLRVQST